MQLTKIFSGSIIFFALVLVVIFSQFILLKPIIGQGLTNEDYGGFYQIRFNKDQMFSDPIGTWKKVGIHNIAHDFYLGILDSLYGKNYTMYLYTTIFFKIITTLLLYPLILILTKNKLFSFLGTLLYALSYPSTGALHLYVVGNEYLGVSLMLLFLIIYYYCVKKPAIITLLLLSWVIALGYLVSPIRIFPIFAVLLLIELSILIRNKFSNFIVSALRLIAIFLPIAIITLNSLDGVGGDAYSPAGWPDFIKKITNGNWYFLLNPLWGLGYTFLPAASLNIFVPINISSMSAYISSLIYKPFIIFGAISLILSFIISNKPFRFFSILMLINLIFDVIIFVLYTHHFGIPKDLVIGYAGPSFNAGLYSGILAAFIISISISCGIEWYLTGKKNTLLFFAFLSPLLALLFILGQWFFTRDYYMYQEGIHRYFVISAIGSYLFIASILTLLYQRNKRINKVLVSLLILAVIFQIFSISQAEIAQLFYGKKSSGRDLQIQESMKAQALSYISKDKMNDNLLIYIKFKTEGVEAPDQWEDTFDWRNLTFWLPIEMSYVTNNTTSACVALTWDFSELQKMATIQNGSKEFLYRNEGNKEMRCIHNGEGYSLDGKFISLENLYAFAVEGPKVINITDEVKKRLVFSN